MESITHQEERASELDFERHRAITKACEGTAHEGYGRVMSSGIQNGSTTFE